MLARTALGKRAGSLLERPGLRVGVLRDSGMHDYLSLAHPQALVQAFADLDGAAAALLDGQTYLLVIDRPRLRDWLTHHAGIGLAAGYEELPDAGDALVIAVPWHRRRLLDWLNGTLDILDAQGVLTSLEARYLEPGVTGAERTP